MFPVKQMLSSEIQPQIELECICSVSEVYVQFQKSCIVQCVRSVFTAFTEGTLHVLECVCSVHCRYCRCTPIRFGPILFAVSQILEAYCHLRKKYMTKTLCNKLGPSTIFHTTLMNTVVSIYP